MARLLLIIILVFCCAGGFCVPKQPKINQSNSLDNPTPNSLPNTSEMESTKPIPNSSQNTPLPDSFTEQPQPNKTVRPANSQALKTPLNCTMERVLPELITPLLREEGQFIAFSATPENDKENIFEFDTQISTVIDGDSFSVLTEKTAYRIGICGIDAPELGQEFGTEAKRQLEKLKGQTVKVRVVGKDNRKRMIAEVMLHGKNVAERMLSLGLAWYDSSHGTSTLLQELESKAKLKRIGLWSNENPKPPREFRLQEKAKVFETKCAKLAEERQKLANQTLEWNHLKPGLVGYLHDKFDVVEVASDRVVIRKICPEQIVGGTFYEGGQFTPGGGRAPAGGIWYGRQILPELTVYLFWHVDGECQLIEGETIQLSHLIAVLEGKTSEEQHEFRIGYFDPNDIREK